MSVMTNTPTMFGITVFRAVTTRAISTKECPWLSKDVPQGTLFAIGYDAYGVCTPAGTMVRYEGTELCFELPTDALLGIDEEASIG
jgi:hypothetical protein